MIFKNVSLLLILFSGMPSTFASAANDIVLNCAGVLTGGMLGVNEAEGRRVSIQLKKTGEQAYLFSFTYSQRFDGNFTQTLELSRDDVQMISTTTVNMIHIEKKISNEAVFLNLDASSSNLNFGSAKASLEFTSGKGLNVHADSLVCRKF